MSRLYQVIASDPASPAQTQSQSVALECGTIEDALFQSFLMLDAGQVVWSITGPDVELTREQIKRKWRAARQ